MSHALNRRSAIRLVAALGLAAAALAPAGPSRAADPIRIGFGMKGLAFGAGAAGRAENSGSPCARNRFSRAARQPLGLGF